MTGAVRFEPIYHLDSGGPNVPNICQKKPGGRFSWNLRLSSVDSSKVTELELGRITKVVRPWIEVTKPETGGESGHDNFTLTAHTLGSLATGTTSQWGPLLLVGSSRATVLSLAHFTGRKKLFTFLKDRLSITVEGLRPPNRKNKKRTKRRAVERFEGNVENIVKNTLIRDYYYLFRSKQSRENYAKQIGKVSFNSLRKRYIFYKIKSLHDSSEMNYTVIK